MAALWMSKLLDATLLQRFKWRCTSSVHYSTTKLWSIGHICYHVEESTWWEHLPENKGDLSLSLSLLLRNSALQIKMKKIITWQRKILLQVVNFGSKAVNLNISVTGLETDIQTFGSIKTVLTSGWLRDENSFQQPDKVWYCRVSTWFNAWETKSNMVVITPWISCCVCDVWTFVL